MITRLKLKSGQKGTKALVEQYGDSLVCVRYRYDQASRTRIKTVELIVEKKELSSRQNKFEAEALAPEKPLDAGRIIPELTFGFWTSLFDVRYEKILWPWLLKPVVPNMPRHIRIRKNLSKRLNRVRTLRNRIFHHEPIWHWRDLQSQHTDIIETITWVNPAMMAFVEPFDRFEEIYKNGVGEYRKIITALP